MIDLFAKSYPDELLYSLLGRCQLERSSEGAFTAAIDFETQVEKLLSRLLAGDTQALSGVINSHTLFPFYSAFTPSARVQRVLKGIPLSGVMRTRSQLRVQARKNERLTLRYCPACVREDRRLFGQTYWRRLPQVPDVDVCVVHETYFVATEIESAEWVNGSMLVTAEEVIGADSRSQRTGRDPYFSQRLRIAQDAAWLLENPISGHRPGALKNRYLELCFRRGSCSYSGVLRSTFRQEIRDFYTEKFLQQIGCAFSDTNRRLSRLVHETGGAQPTIIHLLLLQFLGVTTREFFELPEVRQPFGSGPWPCLNSAGEHLGQRLITTVEISLTTRRHQRLPLGTFRCVCGFAYTRVGPDRSDLDQFHIDDYVSFGEQWDNHVRALFNAGEQLDGIASSLDISKRTLSRQLARLGLDPAATEQSKVARSSH